jgi:hypothetical protein
MLLDIQRNLPVAGAKFDLTLEETNVWLARSFLLTGGSAGL